MSIARSDGVEIYYERAGGGTAAAADHGARDDRHRLVAHGARAGRGVHGAVVRQPRRRAQRPASGAVQLRADGGRRDRGAGRCRSRCRPRLRRLAGRHDRPGDRAAAAGARARRWCSPRPRPAGRAPSRPITRRWRSSGVAARCLPKRRSGRRFRTTTLRERARSPATGSPRTSPSACASRSSASPIGAAGGRARPRHLGTARSRRRARRSSSTEPRTGWWSPATPGCWPRAFRRAAAALGGDRPPLLHRRAARGSRDRRSSCARAERGMQRQRVAR